MANFMIFINLAMVLIKKWFGYSEEQKKIKKEAIDEIKEARRNKDVSGITAGLDRLRRM